MRFLLSLLHLSLICYLFFFSGFIYSCFLFSFASCHFSSGGTGEDFLRFIFSLVICIVFFLSLLFFFFSFVSIFSRHILLSCSRLVSVCGVLLPLPLICFLFLCFLLFALSLLFWVLSFPLSRSEGVFSIPVCCAIIYITFSSVARKNRPNEDETRGIIGWRRKRARERVPLRAIQTGDFLEHQWQGCFFRGMKSGAGQDGGGWGDDGATSETKQTSTVSFFGSFTMIPGFPRPPD